MIGLFDLAFLQGDPRQALKGINTVVLTAAMAARYFGEDDPLGEVLIYDEDRLLQVTGVVEDMPFNTHFQFDYLISMETFTQVLVEAGYERLLNARNWWGMYTYVLLEENHSLEQVEAKVPDFLANFFRDNGTREEILAQMHLRLQPIKDIHLYSKLGGEMGANSDIAYVYIFSAAALLILLLAGVNFVNISTAQAMMRAKEIGVRKVVGAQRQQLVGQFLGEAMLSAFAALIVAVVLLKVALPFYNGFTGMTLDFAELFLPGNAAIIFALVLSIGLLASWPGLIAISPTFTSSRQRRC